MNYDVRPACDFSADWLEACFVDFRERAVENKNASVEYSNPVDREVLSFVHFVKSGNLQGAVEYSKDVVCQEKWLSYLLAAVDRIDSDWKAGELSLTETMEAFWAIQNLIEKRSKSTPNRKTDIHVDKKCLVWVSPDEEHTFGAQILVDTMGRRGWSVTPFLQCDASSVLNRLSTESFDLLCLSAGCDERFLGLADFVEEARIESLNPRLNVVAGGAAFSGKASQYSFIGADFVSTDPNSVILEP